MTGLSQFFKARSEAKKQKKLDMQLRIEQWDLQNLEKLKIGRVAELGKKYPEAQTVYIQRMEAYKNKLAEAEALKHTKGYKSPRSLKISTKNIGKGIQSFFKFVGESMDNIGKMGDQMSRNFEYGVLGNGNKRRK